MRRGAAILCAVALATTAAACTISNDDSPRDIPAGDQRELGVDTERPAGAARGLARIYLLAPSISGDAASLTPVARDVAETPIAVVQSLLSGANADELARQFRSAVPAGTRLLSAKLQAGTLRIDVSKELLQLSGSDLVDALAQIVFTTSELDGVRAVKLLVEGADQQWPAGNGALQGAALTVYDYPGRVASAQPDYPAIPSPSMP
jgi:spore germination protein GerM